MPPIAKIMVYLLPAKFFVRKSRIIYINRHFNKPAYYHSGFGGAKNKTEYIPAFTNCITALLFHPDIFRIFYLHIRVIA